MSSLMSAQRLSASKIGTVEEIVFLFALLFVLNAFRHQRLEQVGVYRKDNKIFPCSTPFGIKDWNRMQVAASIAGAFRCSTPFGIKDWNRGIVDRNQFETALVLNAFRHQRLEQLNFLKPR